MEKSICRQCREEFEEDHENKAVICPACNKKQRSEIEFFQTLKTLSFCFALMPLVLFIPLSMARETSPGYYELANSKGRPIPITGNGIITFMIVIVILSIIFLILGFWFNGKKQEKETVYQNDYSSIK